MKNEHFRDLNNKGGYLGFFCEKIWCQRDLGLNRGSTNVITVNPESTKNTD